MHPTLINFFGEFYISAVFCVRVFVFSLLGATLFECNVLRIVGHYAMYILVKVLENSVQRSLENGI